MAWIGVAVATFVLSADGEVQAERLQKFLSEKCAALEWRNQECLRAMYRQDVVWWLAGKGETMLDSLPDEQLAFLSPLKGAALPQPDIERACGRSLLDVVNEERQATVEHGCLFSHVHLELGRWGAGDPSEFRSAAEEVKEDLESYRGTDGYQSTRWGMSVAQVRKLYRASRTKEGDLVMRGVVAGLGAATTFRFVDNRLFEVAVDFTVKHHHPDRYVEDFGKIRELLAKKYGTPKDSSKGETLIDGIYGAVGGVGRSVRGGHEELTSEWVLSSTGISLRLRGEDLAIQHTLTYRSVVLAGIHDLRERESHLEDL